MNDIKLQGLDAEGNEKGFSLNDFKGQKVKPDTSFWQGRTGNTII